MELYQRRSRGSGFFRQILAICKPARTDVSPYLKELAQLAKQSTGRDIPVQPPTVTPDVTEMGCGFHRFLQKRAHLSSGELARRRTFGRPQRAEANQTIPQKACGGLRQPDG